jgi:uncharacterized membrane protein YeaQ/YmgE (transglycosylase-associated protein family)
MIRNSVRRDRTLKTRMARLPGGANRYAAVTAGLFLWGTVGAVLEDVALLHDVVSVMTPWLAVILIGALFRQPSPTGVFISTVLGSVGGVVAYYAWRDLAGQVLFVPGLLLWTAVAFVASVVVTALTLWTRQSPSWTVPLLLAGGGFGVGEAIWLVATSEPGAGTVLAAGADVALASLLLVLADRSRAPAAARPGVAGQKLERLGWLGSGAAFFWIVLLSIRTVMP